MGKPILSSDQKSMTGWSQPGATDKRNRYGKYTGTWEGDTFTYDKPRTDYTRNAFVDMALRIHKMGPYGSGGGSPAPTPQRKTLGTSGGSTSSSGTSAKRRRTVLTGVSTGSGQSSILGRSM